MADVFTLDDGNIVVDGIHYVPSASAAKKTWPGLVEKDGRVRVRLDGKIYELHAMRVALQLLRERKERVRIEVGVDRYNCVQERILRRAADGGGLIDT